MADAEALYDALRNMKQVTLFYTKRDGTAVTHTGGIYEINGDLLWLWDTTLNDNIRKFFISSINSYEVLALDFVRPNAWPIKFNGEILIP